MSLDQDDLDRFMASIDQTRAAYGLPPEPREFPTFEEMREGEHRHAILAIGAALTDHEGTHAGTDWLAYWLKRVTHNRDLSQFAFHTIRAGCWDRETARGLVLDAWALPEWPGSWPNQQWRDTFARVGGLPLRTNEEEDHTHDEPVPVWRAAFSSHKRGLSWTTDRNRALWFHKRGDMSGKGRVMRLWTTVVPPERILAYVDSRGESEIVADVRRLKVTEESG